MPIIDWNSTAAWLAIFVTLAISIITPAVSTFLTNRFQLKLKKMELQHNDSETAYNKKLMAFENALRDLGKFLHFTSKENFASVGEHLYELYLYLPSEHWLLLDSLASSLQEKNCSLAHTQLIELSKILSAELSATEKCDIKSI